MMTNAVRKTYFFGLLFILFLLSGAYYLEYGLKIIPCSLCLLQRIIMMILGVLFLTGALLAVKRSVQFFIGSLGLLASLAGMALAARQVWLQYWPPVGFGECGMDLRTLFKVFQITDALQFIWQGGVECSRKVIVFLSLSLAEWSLICFTLCFFLIVLQWKRILSK